MGKLGGCFAQRALVQKLRYSMGKWLLRDQEFDLRRTREYIWQKHSPSSWNHTPSSAPFTPKLRETGGLDTERLCAKIEGCFVHFDGSFTRPMLPRRTDQSRPHDNSWGFIPRKMNSQKTTHLTWHGRPHQQQYDKEKNETFSESERVFLTPVGCCFQPRNFTWIYSSWYTAAPMPQPEPSLMISLSEGALLHFSEKGSCTMLSKTSFLTNLKSKSPDTWRGAPKTETFKIACCCIATKVEMLSRWKDLR